MKFDSSPQLAKEVLTPGLKHVLDLPSAVRKPTGVRLEESRLDFFGSPLGLIADESISNRIENMQTGTFPNEADPARATHQSSPTVEEIEKHKSSTMKMP